MNNNPSNGTAAGPETRCAIYLNSKVRCRLLASHWYVGHELRTEHEYDPDEIRAAFPKYDDATVKAFSNIKDDARASSVPAHSEPKSLQQLGLEIRAINAANGWAVTQLEEFADKYKFPAVLMLIVSEAAEALEAFRESDVEHFKEEMADILIRALDCAVAIDSDFDATVEAKLKINRGRGYHHGGKKRI